MVKAQSLSYGFVVTSTAASTKDPAQVLRAALAKCKEGATVGIFLIGDGVYIATSRPKNDDATSTLLKTIKEGAKVLISKDHLDATGLTADHLPKGINIIEKPYKELVTKVMEEWDRVIVC